MKISKTLTHFLFRKKGWQYTLIVLLIFTPAFAFHDIWQYPDKQTKSNSRVAINFFFMA